MLVAHRCLNLERERENGRNSIDDDGDDVIPRTNPPLQWLFISASSSSLLATMWNEDSSPFHWFSFSSLRASNEAGRRRHHDTSSPSSLLPFPFYFQIFILFDYFVCRERGV